MFFMRETQLRGALNDVESLVAAAARRSRYQTGVTRLQHAQNRQ